MTRVLGGVCFLRGVQGGMEMISLSKVGVGYHFIGLLDVIVHMLHIPCCNFCGFLPLIFLKLYFLRHHYSQVESVFLRAQESLNTCLLL